MPGDAADPCPPGDCARAVRLAGTLASNRGPACQPRERRAVRGVGYLGSAVGAVAPGWLAGGIELVSVRDSFREDQLAAARDLQQVTLGGMLDPDAMRTTEQFPGGDDALGGGMGGGPG